MIADFGERDVKVGCDKAPSEAQVRGAIAIAEQHAKLLQGADPCFVAGFQQLAEALLQAPSPYTEARVRVCFCVAGCKRTA